MKTKRDDKQSAYAAFLRGINNLGQKPVKMDELKKAFESLGLKNVKTLLASGNVVFDSPNSSPSALAKTIEEKLKKKLGHEIVVLIREIGELKRLAEINPFKGIKLTPQTRLYVTFLSEKPKGGLKIPYESPDKSFKLLRATESEVFSVVTLSQNSGTTDLMGFLEKQFGRKITTRNWNTIERVLGTNKS
jgi:uncharacterized protein (DUF1697 family)